MTALPAPVVALGSGGVSGPRLWRCERVFAKKKRSRSITRPIVDGESVMRCSWTRAFWMRSLPIVG